MSVFWFFMLGVTVLCPLTMVVLGACFVKVPPERINSFYGYRTARSMKNRETWIFAHHCCGRYWQRIGRWVLVLSVLGMVCVFGRDMNTVSAVGTVLVFCK